MNGVSLSKWIRKQKGRDDPIGDLAFDASADPNWPPAADLDELRDYLPESLHRILEEAEDEYREEAS
jgi:YozE SAM-like protein